MISQFIETLSLKDKKLKQLFALIIEHEPISKSDLITLSGLSRTTCSRLIEELVEQGLILENGFGESSGGRKPSLYEINAEAGNIIGIDISRTYTKVLLMDLKLAVKAEARLKMDHTSTPDVTIDFIGKQIITMLKEQQLESGEILGIGIGTVGPLNLEQGIILNPNQFPSPGWLNIPIQDILNKRLGMKVIIDYGVNAALLAEYQNSLNKTYKNVVYMVKGVGSRSGFIIDGRLKPGTDKVGIFGHGHMVVDIHGRKCICGSYGCVQAYSSISVMKSDVINALKKGKDSLLRERVKDIEQVQFDDICQAVNDNDTLCCDIIENAAYYTGMGISNLINVLHPELIILGGPTYNMNLFYETVAKVATERSKIIYPNHEIQFSRGNLGENAIAIGAGRILLSHCLN